MPSFRKTPAGSQDAAPTPSVVKATVPGGHGHGVQQSLLLPAGPERHPSPDPVACSPGKQLWLSIYLPQLALEALFQRDDQRACAVVEERQGVRRILAANRVARAAGVCVGQSVNAALSLRPELELGDRYPAQEEMLVKRLARWGERFTSFVAIEAPNVLLLELAGSERLFAGIDALRRRIARGLAAQGLTTVLAIAPTPLASTWLAKAGREVCLRDRSQLVSSLAKLPVNRLGWPRAVTENLAGMGISDVGDCLRLPRPGFVRRFSAGLLLQLDRATGRLPDPRKNYRAPEHFSADAEFDAEEDKSERLLPVCRNLLLDLERFLRTRQIRIQRLRFHFFHLQQAATSLTLGRVQAGQDVDHWFDLLRIRFEQTVLPAPVIAIRLRGGQGQQSSMETDGLTFADTVTGRDTSIDSLVERLSARIGDKAVHGVTAVAEHRPQHAWRRSSLLDEAPHCAAVNTFGYWNEREMPALLHDARRSGHLLLRRPLWILDPPEALAVRDGRPVYRGVLTCVDGPERLESGWWDDEGIARDYYVALTEDGVHVWVYRDRHRQNRNDSNNKAHWFLHGIFA